MLNTTPKTRNPHDEESRLSIWSHSVLLVTAKLTQTSQITLIREAFKIKLVCWVKAHILKPKPKSRKGSQHSKLDEAWQYFMLTHVVVVKQSGRLMSGSLTVLGARILTADQLCILLLQSSLSTGMWLMCPTGNKPETLALRARGWSPKFNCVSARLPSTFKRERASFAMQVKERSLSKPERSSNTSAEFTPKFTLVRDFTLGVPRSERYQLQNKSRFWRLTQLPRSKFVSMAWDRKSDFKSGRSGVQDTWLLMISVAELVVARSQPLSCSSWGLCFHGKRAWLISGMTIRPPILNCIVRETGLELQSWPGSSRNWS